MLSTKWSHADTRPLSTHEYLGTNLFFRYIFGFGFVSPIHLRGCFCACLAFSALTPTRAIRVFRKFCFVVVVAVIVWCLIYTQSPRNRRNKGIWCVFVFVIIGMDFPDYEFVVAVECSCWCEAPHIRIVNDILVHYYYLFVYWLFNTLHYLLRILFLADKCYWNVWKY